MNEIENWWTSMYFMDDHIILDRTIADTVQMSYQVQ